jgi:hypothetical protein
MKLPKAGSGEILVTGHSWSWTPGTHHIQIYRTTSDLPANVDLTKSFDCFAPGASQYTSAAAIVTEEQSTGQSQFPAGTAFAFHSEEIVVFHVHSVNASPAPQTSQVTLTFQVAPAGTVQNRLGLIQFYDPFIVVPANASALAQMRCKIPRDITILRATTHSHGRTVDDKAYLDAPDGTGGPIGATTPLVESKDWEHPAEWADGRTLQVPAGSHVRMSCAYQGTPGQDVIQGQDFRDNEMCAFRAYYYPVIDPLFEVCLTDPALGASYGDEYGSGTKSCGELAACIQGCPPSDAPNVSDGKIDIGKCYQSCVVDSCPDAFAPFATLSACVQKNCAAQCASGPTGCASCTAAACAAEYGACQGTPCGQPPASP